MTDAELARHDSKTLLQLLLSADARIDALTAQLESTLKDRRLILEERDRNFALMLARAEKAKAERDRLRALLSEADRRITWEAVGFGNDFADQVQAALKGETNE